MEEPQQGSQAVEDRSIKTGEALHVLRNKLAARQEVERKKASSSQADIISRIFQIAEEMAVEQTTEVQAEVLLNQERSACLQETLAERESLVAQLQTQVGELEQDRNRLQSELQDLQASTDELQATECGACAELRQQLSAVEERATAAETSVDQFQKDAEAALKEIAELQSWRDSAASLDEQTARLREEAQQADERNKKLNDELSALTSERDSLAEELVKLSCDLERRLADAVNAESNLQVELEAASKQAGENELRITSLEEERDALVFQAAESEATVARLQEEAAGLESRSQSEFSAERQKLQEVEQGFANLQQERDALAEELAELQSTVALLQGEKEAESDSLQVQLATAQSLAKQAQADYLALSVEHEELSAKWAVQSAELSAKQAESTDLVAARESELATLQAQLAQLTTANLHLETNHAELSQQLDEANAKFEQTAVRLQDAEQQLSDMPTLQEQSEEQAKAQRKFELALADAQKLKRENAALQEELATRPEANEQESPELVSLRAERDALAARVAELEEMPAPTVDEDTQERMADLQRRFEMAVDDLRQVKQQKAQLEEKLASAPRGVAPAVDSGAMDWQSQKARLLASLESEDGETDEEPTPERVQEKLSIQSTIEITDQVVADKDREIAELQARLAERAENAAPVPVVDVCDKDEHIQAERAKLEQLQAEWRNKLRGAELEMSTQRAALARKEAELKTLLATAEAATADAALMNDGKPRRRWLSALGLSEDEANKE